MFNTDWILSTDLDGTLLDHHTYDWKAILPSLEIIKSEKILLVFNTSKTFQEARALQMDLEIEAPVIIENGSALAVPGSLLSFFDLSENDTDCKVIDGFVVKNFGRDREEILSYLTTQREKYGKVFESYNDWGLSTIMEKTGLSENVARMSSAKEYSEPFVWFGDEGVLKDFIFDAKEKGFHVLQGGRFFHLLGDTNKSVPLVWLKDQISKGTDKATTIVALGDNKNDIDMLNVADIPVVVKSPISEYPKISENPNAIYTKEYGPIGWNGAILRILNNN